VLSRRRVSVELTQAVSLMTQSSRKRKWHVTLIGAGNLASAIGPALRAAGYTIDVVAGRALAASQRRASALAKKLGARPLRLENRETSPGIILSFNTVDSLAETC